MAEGRAKPTRDAVVRVSRDHTDGAGRAVIDNMSLFSAGSWASADVVTDPFWLSTWRSMVDSILHADRVAYFEPNAQAKQSYIEPPAREVLRASGLLQVVPGRHSTEEVPIGEVELNRQADYAVKVLTDISSLRLVDAAYRWLSSYRRGSLRDLANTEPSSAEFEEFWERELGARVEEALAGSAVRPERVKALMRLSVRGVQYQHLVNTHLIGSHYIDHPLRRRPAAVEEGESHREFLLDWSPLLQIRFADAKTEWPTIARILGNLRPRIRDAGLHPDDNPFGTLELEAVRERCREVAYLSGIPLEWDSQERRRVLLLLRRESDVFNSTALGVFFHLVGATVPGWTVGAGVARALAEGLVTTRVGWWLSARVENAAKKVKHVPPGLGKFGARLVRRDYFEQIRLPDE